MISVIGPVTEFSEEEIVNLDTYIANGGAVIVFVRAIYNDAPFDSFPLTEWLAKYGVVVEPGVVKVKMLSRSGSILDNFGIHAITRMFRDDDFIFSFYPKALNDTDKMPDGITANSLLSTSSEDILFRDLKKDGEPGSFPIAKAITGKVNDSSDDFRMVVVGDMLIASNRFLKSSGVNKDFILNCFNWLAEEENLVNIDVKSPIEAHFRFTGKTLTVIAYFLLLGLPLLALYAGVCVWLMRRK